LEKLSWARRIVIVDSFSTDATEAIVRANPRVHWVQRAFDDHSSQWNYATQHSAIETPWVLALDADYVLSDELVEELRALSAPANISGYRARFRFCSLGRPLRGSLYPPVTVLYRRAAARYAQDGHTQRLILDGAVQQLASFIYHDDRKPFRHWIQAQERYARLEADKLAQTPFTDLSWPGRIRSVPFLSALPVLFYCLALRGAVLDGKAGAFYATQRVIAELMISKAVIQHRLQVATKKPA
jgi:hypothetical protein